MADLNKLTEKLEADKGLMNKMEAQASIHGLVAVASDLGFEVEPKELYDHISTKMPALHSVLCCGGGGTGGSGGGTTMCGCNKYDSCC